MINKNMSSISGLSFFAELPDLEAKI